MTSQRLPAVVTVAALMHLVWAYCLLVDPSSINVTAMYGIKFLALSLPTTILVLYAVAALALCALPLRSGWGRVLCILPQQVILLISAVGVLRAMWFGEFADGTLRTSPFLIADQIPVLLLAGFHMLSVYRVVIAIEL